MPLACGLLACSPVLPEEKPAGARPNAVVLFGARMTDNNAQDILTLNDIRLRDSYLVGVGISREIGRISDKAAFEIEGQLVRNFGAQRLWEINAAVTGRWVHFPWNETLPTSLAWGIGPSYATRTPAEEVDRTGDSQRVLVYWHAEVEVGLPGNPWTGLARIHHRSGAFGIVADEGGANWLTLGVRRRF